MDDEVTGMGISQGMRNSLSGNGNQSGNGISCSMTYRG